MNKPTKLVNGLHSVFLAVLASMSVSGTANAQTVIYGRFDVSVQNEDSDAANNDAYAVKSHASRFGVKGKHKLDASDLHVIYKYELEIDPEEDSLNDSSDEKFLKARNQYVGLKGNFGTIQLGRLDSPVKTAQGKVDLFGNHQGDIKNYMSGENRLGDSINFTSPVFADSFKFRISLYPGEDTTLANENDGLAEGSSLNLAYKKDSLYLALGYDNEVGNFRFGTTSQLDDLTRLVFGYKMEKIKLGALYQEADSVAEDQESAYMLSAGFSTDAKTTYKVQYGASEVENIANAITSDITSLSLGVDYKLAITTKVYGEYTQQTDELTDLDTSILGVGLQHKF